MVLWGAWGEALLNAGRVVKQRCLEFQRMKGKVHDLATTLQSQNEELSIEKGHMHSIKADNANQSTGMQGQLNDIKRYFSADVQRMMEEILGLKFIVESLRLDQQCQHPFFATLFRLKPFV
eukprot:g32833.t1